MLTEQFDLVPHDDAFVSQALSEPETKRAYDELAAEYSELSTELQTRREAELAMTTEEMHMARLNGESQSDRNVFVVWCKMELSQQKMMTLIALDLRSACDHRRYSVHALLA
jgi:hypothetical protein